LLLQDESEFVRHRFVEKLCDRLMQWKQQRYGLPSTFISYFVLAGLEQDEEMKSCMSRGLNLCVQDKRHQVWSFIYVKRGLILIPKMAYLKAISQQIGLTYSKNYVLFNVSVFCIYLITLNVRGMGNMNFEEQLFHHNL
jgi:hypothetical protein